jgi:hypothetical protein
MQSDAMETDWAAEHLQTIRTLMERSAVYRRALAPIMVWNGIVGLVVGGVAWKFFPQSGRLFFEIWSGAALLAIAGSFLLVRRQAIKDSEPFWSPPTRRVAHGLLPPLFIGGMMNFLALNAGNFLSDDEIVSILFVIFWLCLYGCAVNAAGFFMPRGIRLFGWVFIAMGMFLAAGILFADQWVVILSPHLVMAWAFGGFHLGYGVYLYITERGKNAW